MKRFTMLSVAGMDKAREVVEVTLGREKADLVITNGTLLNVYTRELLPRQNVATKGEWIAYVGPDVQERIGPNTKVIDALGKVVVPGFIDSHAHIADGFLKPSEFLRYTIAGGTTTIVTETIEPYPITGYEGLLDFLAALQDQPIKVFATAPALVSTSESARGLPEDVLGKLLSRDDVLGLGESYWQGVLQEPELFFPNFKKTLDMGKKLEGHSAGAKGSRLMAYFSTGISSCHESTNAQDVLERLRLGIHVMVREGSNRQELDEIARIKDAGIDLRRLILVTDGLNPVDLHDLGNVDYVVQKAIDCGFDPVSAIQMATVNPAEYLSLEGILGGIAPGRYADLVILPDIQTIKPEWVISMGQIAFRAGELLLRPREHVFSPKNLNTVHLTNRFEASNFSISAAGRTSPVKVRVIDQVTDLVTKESVASLPVIDGKIQSDPGRDLLKIAAIDRVFSPGKRSLGFIRGFSLRAGAAASSSAWDTSDIIVVGENEQDMAGAVNRVVELRGGAVFCVGGKIAAEIPLPIFGLMSDLPMESLVQGYRKLAQAMKDLGCPLKDPLRTLTTLTCAAIPFLRICEEGLVDIKTGKKVSLFVD
jgi:adenine deaminase